jgi:hypothetical protein
MKDPRYQARDKSSSAKINDAVKHSSRKRMKCATTDIDFEAGAKKRFDDNYDAIFGKKELKHGRD